jgi:predicted O-linked N-acetylglucosamine transferase (SPINDLY family)
MEIDIAVDLMGHTRNARLGIFPFRPAPIQVNYLGYPGTLGMDCIDYIVADSTLIPSSEESAYDEKVVYMPNSYQANDSTKPISGNPLHRSDHGLPEQGFVYCCFNNNHKISPEVFDIWMRLLRADDASVLWLFAGNPAATENLRKEAGRRGVAPGRLIFAPRLELPDHLARHRLADLFLDTFYYGAHTTASDALWAGLPVVTRIGDAFAGRVAASLLRALDLPELIASTDAEYEALALRLSQHPVQLAAIREKLARHRTSRALYDAAGFAADIETAYGAMWERHQAGLPPDRIVVARCRGNVRTFGSPGGGRT